MNIWFVFYLLQLILLSFAFGSVCIQHPFFPATNRFHRFLFGFATTPFILGLITILMAAIFPGMPAYWYLLIPGLSSFLYLLNRIELFKSLFLRFDLSKVVHLSVFNKLIVSGFFLVCSVMSLNLFKQIGTPWSHHDALIYANEALYFAEYRDLAHIPDFKQNSFEKLAPGHPHSFIYQAYLAQALMAAPPESMGYPNDYSARFANKILFFYLLIAIVVCCWSMSTFFAGLLSVIVLPTLINLQHMVYASSRDSFRIIPLLLLFACLVLSMREPNKKINLLYCVSFILCSAFCLGAHTLNGVVLFMIACSWLMSSFLYKSKKKQILQITLTCAIGLLFAGLHYLKSFYDTGNAMGYGFDFYSFVGTPLYEATLKTAQYSLAYSLNTYQKMLYIFKMDRFTISIFSVFGAVVVILYSLFRRKKVEQSNPQNRQIFCLALFLLLAFLPMTGVFDIGEHKLSKMFIVNYRYILFFFPFASIFAAVLFCKSQDQNKQSPIIIPTIIACLLVLSTLQISRWRVESHLSFENSSFYKIAQIFKTLPQDEKVIVDSPGLGYYLKQKTLSTYAYPAWPLMHATDSQMLEKELFHQLNAKYIVFQEQVENWWDHLYLYHYLESSPHVSLLSQGKDWRIYQLKHNLLK